MTFNLSITVVVLLSTMVLMVLVYEAGAAIEARVWEMQGLDWGDRLQLAEFLSRYEALVGFEVGARRARLLRNELRSNLLEASATVGVQQALKGVGSARSLAKAAGDGERHRPLWAKGLLASLFGFAAVIYLQMAMSTAWFDAAEASGVTHLDGRVHLVPGMSLFFDSAAGADGPSFGFTPGPSSLVVGALVFIAVSRPWRVLRRSGPISQPQ